MAQKPRYYTTSVSIHKSFEAIRKELAGWDADSVTLLEHFKKRQVGVEFVLNEQPIRLVIDANRVLEALEETKGVPKTHRNIEQAMRISMRLLLNYIANVFQMIHWRLLSSTEAFMAHLVLGRGGRTLGDILIKGERIMLTDETLKALPRGKE